MMAARCVKAALALWFVMSCQVALGQERPIAMDAGGRPLSDGQRHIVYDSPPLSILSTRPEAGSSLVAGRRKSQTLRALQSTGVSPSYQVAWRTASFGTGIGATGIWPVDTDNDGDQEMVLGGGQQFGGNSYWSIVGFNAATHVYEILWQSLPYSDPNTWSLTITALRVVESGSTKRVWVGRSDGKVDVVNVLTRQTIQTLAPSTSPVKDFAVADADNDGKIDLVVATDTKIFLYDPATLALTRTIADGAGRIAVGNVDADNNQELVLSSGHVLEIAGVVSVQWASPTPFGARIALADVDGDGRAELVAAEGWQVIRAWDLDTQSLKWSFNTNIDIAALRLIDVVGDATPEIVYGDGQWGAIHVIDAATRTELWNIPNPEHGVTDIAVFDADGDGAREILWGAGWSSTGPDYLYIHDVATQAGEWRSEDFNGPYSAIDMGDVDGDGQLEVVVASFESQSGYADGIIKVFDAHTNVLEWSSRGNEFGGSAWTGIHGLKAINVDSDPQLEIVVVTDRLYDGALYVIDGLTHERQNEAFYDSGSPLNVLDAYDLTGDGKPEIVTGNTVAHTGSPGVFIYVLDPLTDAVVWKSAVIASGFSSITDVLVADAGANGVDLLAVSNSINVVRWSDKRRLISATTGYLSVAVGDVDAAAGAEILAGRSDGRVAVLNGETLTEIATYPVCAEPINALQMHSSSQLLMTCGDKLVVYSLTSHSIVDVTQTGMGQLGMNSGLVRVVDNNRAVVLTSGNEALKFVDVSNNHLPVISAAAATVHWRGTTDLQLAATDADNDPLRFELVSLPALGSATWQDPASGKLRYAAAGSGVGNDSMVVRVSDGSQYSSQQVVSITLTNTSPVGQTRTLSFHWRGIQTASLQASDSNGDPLTFSITGLPAHGSVTLNDTATGALTFTPSAPFVGTDLLSYTVSDGAGNELVPVQVTLTNSAPVADSAQYDVTPGTTIHGRFAATDADGDPLLYSVTQQPGLGTLTYEAATGLFEYVPHAGVTGTDSVTYSISDGVTQSQATLSFRYPGTQGGGNGSGGGGGVDFTTLLILFSLLSLTAVRRSTRIFQYAAPELSREERG